jgi:LuxR family maltose regulon positive regulatory protein
MSDSSGDVLTISGDDRYVADYLYRESLMQLPESVQRFLRCTAVLDQLCAPLCDAILEEAHVSGQIRVAGDPCICRRQQRQQG